MLWPAIQASVLVSEREMVCFELMSSDFGSVVVASLSGDATLLPGLLDPVLKPGGTHPS